MQHEVASSKIACPYCGETIEVLVDCSIPQQSYIEDCQVCCRPIGLTLCVDEDGAFDIVVTHEDE